MGREERIKMEQEVINGFIDGIKDKLTNIPLVDGVDKNSWLLAGCMQDLEAARTRINNYIERCLR